MGIGGVLVTFPFPVFISSAWSPLKLSPLGWWDAKDYSTITESGGAVSQWSDKSGNSNHVLQSNGSYKPTYSATGFASAPSILFDGTDDFLERQTINVNTTKLTCSMVFVQVSYKVWASWMSGQVNGQYDYNSTTGFGWSSYNTDGTEAHFTRNSTNYRAGTGTIAYGTKYHLQIVVDGSSFVMYRNNSSIYSNSITSGTFTSAMEFVMGGQHTSSSTRTNCANMHLMEVVLTNTALDSTDRGLLHTYLQSKWSL